MRHANASSCVAIYYDTFTDKFHTYDDIQRLSKNFGQGLRSHFNWQKDDVLCLCAANSIDTPPVVFGTLWAGGIVTTCNPHYTATELTHQMRDSGARVVVTDSAALPTVRAACRNSGIPDTHIILLNEDRNQHGSYESWRSICSEGANLELSRPSIDPKRDLAFLVYSSGTTGKPKGVRLSHYNLVSNVLQVQPSEQFNLTWNGSKTSSDIPAPCGGDRILACLPFFHIYGLTMFVMCPLYTGTTTYVMSAFEIERWCNLVQKHQITYAYIVPPIALLLAKHASVDKYNLRSLRMTNSGGAPLNRELVMAVFERTGVRIKQGYGLSETSPGAIHQIWDDWLEGAGSVGWLLSNLEMKFCEPLSDDIQRAEPVELPPGATGELYLRGPNIFLGYHNNDAATKECLSADGWFRTGDIGHINENGNVFITDRVKELIKYKGFQVAPAELEGYLLDHPQIEDCAVIGVYSNTRQTEVPRAYVVIKGKDASAASTQDVKEITKWLNSRITNYKRLRGGIEFLSAIPKSPSGKILRRILKERAKLEYKEDGEVIRARL